MYKISVAVTTDVAHQRAPNLFLDVIEEQGAVGATCLSCVEIESWF